MQKDFIYECSKVKHFRLYTRNPHNQRPPSPQRAPPRSSRPPTDHETCHSGILRTVFDFRIKGKHRVLPFLETTQRPKAHHPRGSPPTKPSLVAWRGARLFSQSVYYLFLKVLPSPRTKRVLRPKQRVSGLVRAESGFGGLWVRLVDFGALLPKKSIIDM